MVAHDVSVLFTKDLPEMENVTDAFNFIGPEKTQLKKKMEK